MQLNNGLEKQLAALVADEGLELVTAELVGKGPGTILRLVIDGPDGVTLDQCSIISRQASVILDVDDPIRHAYTLEVSSPGLDRKLFSLDDYRRFVGQQVKIRMKPSYRAHRVVTGELTDVDHDTVTLRLESRELVDLPLDEVFEARLQVDWDAIMKKGKSHS